jgi:hypothetical protein
MFLLRHFLHYHVSSFLCYLLSLHPNMLRRILFSNAVNSILLGLETKVSPIYARGDPKITGI